MAEKINLLCDPKDYELNVIWECLNSVYFTDEQGMLAHRKLLMKYRRQVAKQIHGGDIAPKDLECGTLEHYNDVLKKRRAKERQENPDLAKLEATIGGIG